MPNMLGIKNLALMIRCQNFIVTVNVRSVYRQLQAPTQAFSHLI